MLSLLVAVAATALAAAVAVPAAWLLAGRRVVLVEVLILLPLVLPPTVVGWALVVLLGRSGIGGMIGYSPVLRIEGAVVAAAVVAVPLVFLPSRAGFAGIDTDLLDAARAAGATRWQVLWHVRLPLARRAVLAGLLLGLARALGEFGATLMLVGVQPGRTTLPLEVWRRFERGDLAAAAWPALTLAALAAGLVLVHHRLTR